MNKLDIRNLYLIDFNYNFNKTRQRFLNVILQKGSGVAIIPTLAKKITSKLAKVRKKKRRVIISSTSAASPRNL